MQSSHASSTYKNPSVPENTTCVFTNLLNPMKMKCARSDLDVVSPEARVRHLGLSAWSQRRAQFWCRSSGTSQVMVIVIGAPHQSYQVSSIDNCADVHSRQWGLVPEKKDTYVLHINSILRIHIHESFDAASVAFIDNWDKALLWLPRATGRISAIIFLWWVLFNRDI